MWKVTLTCGLISLLALAGCDKVGQADDDRAPADQTKAVPAETKGDAGDMFPGFDAQAEIKALQGAWKVKDAAFGKDPATWTIAGNKLTVQRGAETQAGELAIAYPGELAFVKKEGGGTSRSYFAYARNGDEVYIGLGTGGVKIGDAYMVGDDGVVVMREQTCKYFKKKMFGGFEDPTNLQCQYKNDGQKQTFTYHIPDRFKKGETREKSVGVYGDALLNEQMTGHKAEKIK